MQVIAQQNDTIDLICWRQFGITAGITEQVMQLNPHIEHNSPTLPVGTVITLPTEQVSIQQTIQLWD